MKLTFIVGNKKAPHYCEASILILSLALKRCRNISRQLRHLRQAFFRQIALLKVVQQLWMLQLQLAEELLFKSAYVLYRNVAASGHLYRGK